MIGPKTVKLPRVRRPFPKTVTPTLRAAMDRRDGHRCAWHGTGCDLDTLVPQHRSNRGQGGDRSKNRLSNLVWLCSEVNGLIESDPEWAERARNLGVKLSLHDDPTVERIDHAVHGLVWLDDAGNVRGKAGI
jgi:hypothetical protein